MVPNEKGTTRHRERLQMAISLSMPPGCLLLVISPLLESYFWVSDTGRGKIHLTAQVSNPCSWSTLAPTVTRGCILQGRAGGAVLRLLMGLVS